MVFGGVRRFIKMKKKIIGMCAGNFDIIHPGYIYTFETAKCHCEKVIYTTRSHGWSTTKIKDMITKQTIKQNPKIIEELK